MILLAAICFLYRDISFAYDFRYSTLLVQYSATSFGDPMFSNYLLIPLQQRFDVKYRKAIWGEHCEVLRIFPLRLESVSAFIVLSHKFIVQLKLPNWPLYKRPNRVKLLKNSSKFYEITDHEKFLVYLCMRDPLNRF